MKNAFPDDFGVKNEDWHLKWMEAAWEEFNSGWPDSLHRSTIEKSSDGLSVYDSIESHMQGTQKIDLFKPLMGVDTNSTDTYMNIDWSILPVMPKQLRVCNGILNKIRYKVGFQPLDQLAIDSKNDFFAEMKARIEMRDQIRKQAGENAEEIINSLGLDKGASEPGDPEELEMMAMYTYKHVASMELEEDVTSVLSMNKIDELRKKNRYNLIAHGIAGFKDYIDSNGALRVRSISPAMLIADPTSLEPDFSDSRYFGEVIMMTVAELAQEDQDISENELNNIASLYVGKYGNPSVHPNGRSAFMSYRIPVVDLEWFSIEQQNWEIGETKYSSLAVSRAPIGRNGEKYVRKRYRVIRKGKWIPGTKRIWNWGLATDMKRAKEQRSEVVSNYHIMAPMRSGNKIQSIGKLVQPILNQIQLSWLKYQKAKSEAKSQGLHIEMGALEDVNYGKGGKVMSPEDIVDLFEQKNILLWRRKGRFGDAEHGAPIQVVQSSGLDDVINWYTTLQNEIQQLKDVIGLNDFTDASTPDARALGATVQTAQISTNNSLFDIIDADVTLMKRLYASVVLRLQDMAEMGLLDKYAMAIGDFSVDFMKKMKHLPHHDFAIEIRELPSEEEKARFVEEAKALVGADMLTFDDWILIKNTDDLKEAERILAWRLKRRKKERMEESLLLQKQNADVQAQSGIAVEEARQKTAQVEGEIKKEVAEIQAAAAIKVAEIQANVSNINKTMEVSSKAEAA